MSFDREKIFKGFKKAIKYPINLIVGKDFYVSETKKKKSSQLYEKIS
jgi:hypothetical protein